MVGRTWCVAGGVSGSVSQVIPVSEGADEDLGPVPERVFKADGVRETLDRLRAEGFTHTENVPETTERFAKKVVESGTFTPDCNVTASVSLTFRERLTGRREQDVTAMLVLGMMLGSALERDVPEDSALEDAWRDGAFTLPDGDSDDSE